MQTVDTSLYEAGYVEGLTNRWQELWFITLPSMKPQLLFGAVMSITGSFGAGSVGDALFGTPSTEYATHTIMNHLNDYGGVRYEMGYACAIATLLFVFMVGANKLIQRIISKVSIDENDFLYVTCSAYSVWDYIGGDVTPVKKLNAKGDDLLHLSPQGYMPYGDRKVVSNGEFAGGSVLVDVQPMEYGLFAVLDSNRDKVFVYNSDYDLLFTFGSPGDVLGALKAPVALAWGNDRFYVADGERQSISIYEPTTYGIFSSLRLRLTN